jgi:hypothetical protein
MKGLYNPNFSSVSGNGKKYPYHAGFPMLPYEPADHGIGLPLKDSFRFL